MPAAGRPRVVSSTCVVIKTNPLLSRGGVDATSSKCCEATFDGADGVVLVHKMYWLINTTPSARTKVASRLFLNRAATPPQLRRGVPFGCFATFIEKSTHPEFLEVRRSELRLPRLLQS